MPRPSRKKEPKEPACLNILIFKDLKRETKKDYGNCKDQIIFFKCLSVQNCSMNRRKYFAHLPKSSGDKMFVLAKYNQFICVVNIGFIVKYKVNRKFFVSISLNNIPIQ